MIQIENGKIKRNKRNSNIAATVFSVRMDNELLARFDEICGKYGVTRNMLISIAVNEYCNKNGEK